MSIFVKWVNSLIMNLLALALMCTMLSAQDIVAKVDEYMNAGVKLGRFSSAVLIAQNDKVLLSNGYGVANYEEDAPIMPFTKFRIASITKEFTAMAILILQERGLLRVEDAICKYVSECPPAWEEVTVHQLLTHTSGVPDWIGFAGSDTMHRLQTPVSSLIARFKSRPLSFKPGEAFRYSNSGYALLGAIIERVSGKSYQAFLQENIFNPLEMKNTGYDDARTILKHRAIGYERDVDKLLNAQYIDMSNPYAAGGLYSTVEDLYVWTQAFAKGTLISERSIAAMTTPFKNNYAYGLSIREEFGRACITGTGAIAGFTSYVGRYPNEKVTIIVLNNITGTSMPAARIAHDLAAIVFGEKYQVMGEHKEIKVDPRIYDAYVGEYERSPGRIYVISKKDDRLFYTFLDKPPFEMLPEAENKFFIKAIDLQFTFVKGDKDLVTHLVLQAPTGEIIEAKKVE